MGYTLFMLIYVCTERQWKDRSMNALHTFNEVIIYIFCLSLVYFSIAETSTASRFALGYISIALFIFWATLNFTFIIW